MGLYLKKSFRAGPVRFNLSKSGIGLSAGVKGARLGVGPRGTYVHAGRQGLYYRKTLSSGYFYKKSCSNGKEILSLLLFVIATVVGMGLVTWLTANPAFLITGTAIGIGVFFVSWWTSSRRKKSLASYKQSLDSAFVKTAGPPSAAVINGLKQQQQHLPKTFAAKRAIEQIETDVYQAVLDKIIDDGFISEQEAMTITAAEQLLAIHPATQLQVKKDIFSAAYVEAIQDREISNDELKKIDSLLAGLAIPRAKVQRELDIIQEIIETQALHLPLSPISPEKLLVPTQKNENAFYQCSAQILSRRKSKGSPAGHEYSVRRIGTMILTNKRVFVVGNGTTNIRLSDINDLNVDIDRGLIEILKIGSGRPIILKTATPIYTGRVIDLLVHAATGEKPI